MDQLPDGLTGHPDRAWESKIPQWVEAEAWQPLSTHLVRHAAVWIQRGDGPALQHLLLTLPANQRIQHPWLDYWLGICLTHSDLLAACPPLERAFHWFRDRQDLAGQCACCAAIIDVLWLQWDDCSALDPWIDMLGPLRLEAERTGRNDLLNGLSRSAFAGISIRRPDHPELPFWETLSLQQLNCQKFSPDLMLRGLQLMIHHTWGVGDRANSTLVLETLSSKLGKSSKQNFTDCIYHVVHAAHLYWFSDQGEACEEVVREGLQLSEELQQPHWDIPMLNCILFKSCALEQTAQVKEWLALLKRRLQLNPRPHDQAIHYHFMAYLAWLKGHADEASGYAHQAYRIACDSGFAYSPLYYGLSLAAIWMDQGEIAPALRQIGRIRRQSQRYHSDNLLFVASLQGAAIARKKGKRQAVIRYLQAALPIGARQRYFAVPWLRLSELASLCAIALQQEIAPEYVRRLISALELKPPNDAILRQNNWPWPCRIHILGQIRILIGDSAASIDGKASSGLYRLLVHLIAAGDKGIDSERLMEQLWPELEPANAYQRLKTGIHRLRKLLGSSDTILHANRRASINPERVWVDAWALEQCAQRSLDPPPGNHRIDHRSIPRPTPSQPV